MTANHGVGVRSDLAGKCLQHGRRIKQWSPGHPDLRAQGRQGAGNGIVFIPGNHCPAAWGNQTFNGQIQGMGRIHGKDHLFRVGQVEQFRQGLPAGKCGIGGQHGRPVTAPARGAHGSHGLRHGRRHRRWFLECGGGTVQVDHPPTSRYTPR